MTTMKRGNTVIKSLGQKRAQKSQHDKAEEKLEYGFILFSMFNEFLLAASHRLGQRDAVMATLGWSDRRQDRKLRVKTAQSCLYQGCLVELLVQLDKM
jgi:hypothetical protein